ncbi:class I SAM-dependent DNA methyltransferase [Jhaorihella thermophila]|uniref:Methyltransferase domain-containing protein n=1 Tax=Jhaorihella thermophila TaxID=488547 RepID=A0A1H5V4D1_9RHOB|nr:class I SAM-dependent methyltransferase [Jhaorihella thermophila]SEF81618.1 Methyltransferase domain-containing protein [Jhaorihella thermophila]
MSDPDTIRLYDRQADRYADLTDGHNAADPLLAAFIAACPKGARVLDLGCGPGASAAAMARAGLRVDAIDASAEMVARAGAHEGVTAWRATFDELGQEAIHDGVWANFSLLHAPRSEMPRHLAAIHRALRPGGVFHLAVKLGQGESRDRLGRFYAYYSEAELDRLLAEAGFAVLGKRFGSGTGLDGSVSDWIAVTARA